MLPNHAPLGWPRSLLKRSDCNHFFGWGVGVKLGKNRRSFLEGVNTLSHQCLGGERRYVT